MYDKVPFISHGIAIFWDVIYNLTHKNLTSSEVQAAEGGVYIA